MGFSGVTVVGSANMDLVVRGPNIPRPGETVICDSVATFPGGKGANQAVAIGKLGGCVRFVGCVGRDDFGSALIASLDEAGVDTSCCDRVDRPTGTALIVVDKSGQNSIAIVPGANAEVSADQVATALAGSESWVLVQQEIPDEAILAALELARGRAVLNPAPARPLPDEAYGGLFAITPNETETEALTGVLPHSEPSCREAARRLLGLGVRHVVLTLGSDGCWWTDGTQEHRFPAPRVQAVDTTAAGDAFNGALAMGLSEGLSLPDCLARAVMVASLSVTRSGAQASMPTKEELRKLL